MRVKEYMSYPSENEQYLKNIFQFKPIVLLSDFQSEIGCTSDFDSSCRLTEFEKKNDVWQLSLKVPAGRWNLKILDADKTYGQFGRVNGEFISLILTSHADIVFIYDESTHRLSVSKDFLESRSQPPLPITLTLDDTLIYDPNSNMIANPGDSIQYTMILKNQSGQSMLNVVITHTGDPNVTFDPNSVKASPLAFNDTINYNAHPKTVLAPGILANDFDLNDVLPNPPNFTNLNVIRVNSLASNVGVSFVTAGGGTVTVNADGTITYDSTGVNGALNDIIYYTILDQDGYEDSASVLIQFNEPPLISSNLAPTDTICAFEQQDTFVMTPLFTITDDGANEESAKIQICSNYLASEDTLIAGSLPGGITATWTDGTGTLMLMGSASLADYETAIESIQYTNQNNNPNTSIRTICITVNDGIVNSNQVTRLLKLKPINDCPTAVRDTFYVAEDDGMGMYSFPLSNVLDNDTDPENNPLTASGLTNFPISGGTVSLGGNGFFAFFRTIGFTGLDSLTEGEMFFARVQYTITDLICTDSDSVIIKVTGVNDAPEIASNLPATDSICAFEQRDTLLVTSAFTLMDDDDQMDSAKISICLNYLSSEDTLIAGSLPGGITAMWNDATGTLMLMGAASKANYETAIEAIQYTNQSNTPNISARRICLTVHDGVANSNSITRELKIKPENDCPIAIRDSISIQENDNIASFIVLANDLDGEMNTLSVTKINNVMSLSMVSINGGTITINGGTGALSFTQTTGFTGLDSLAAGEMFFTRFSYAASDGICEDADSVIIKITGVNDAPLIASNLSPTDSICAFEQRDTFLMTTAFTLMDDEDNTDSAKVSICNNYLASEDTLIVPALPGGITFTWNETTGTMMLMGSASKAAYEAAIESIQYTNQSNTPNMAPRRICITVHDGSLLSNQVTRELKIKPLNDCPTAVRDTFLVNENAAFPPSNVLTNDTDPDMDVLSATPIVNGIVNGGTVNLTSGGAFTFAHATGPMGLDTLNVGEMFFARTLYTISDGACSDNDSVIIKITGVNDAPVADSNSYAVSQTSILTVAAPGLLADDDDIDHNSTIMVAAVKGVPGNVGTLITLPSGAELTVNVNGSFTYNPKCLVSGLDTFSYQIMDEHNLISNPALVYINVDQAMWFVDDNAGTMGIGSFSNPFDQLSDAEGASAVGDYIFVFPGTYGQSITLKNSQKLIGADENWICPSGSTLRTASGNSTINGTITLAQNDTIRGIELGNNAVGIPMIVDNGSSVLNLVISNTNISTTTSSGFKIRNGGVLNVTFDSFNSTSPAGEAMYVNNTTGNVTVSGGNINTGVGAGDTVIVVIGGTVSATISASISQPNNFPTVSISGGHATGTITFQTGTLSATNGSGLQFDNADGTYNFNGTNTLNGGDAGIDILNGSIGTFSFSSGTTITRANGVSGIAFNLANSNANVTYNGNMTLGTGTGNMVAIDNHDAGTMTFSTGNLTKASSTTQGISIQNSGGGTINFNNPTIAITMTSGNAVSLTGANTGGTINFAPSVGGNGIDLVTTSGIGFNSTGGGTISMTGSGNTISSTTGIALNVVSTTIGASGLNFQSISSSGGPNGIVLNGTSGNLTVNGDGSGFANGSGGSLSNITGNGPVSLVSVSGIITLKSMHMSLNINCVFGMLVDNLISGNITTNITGCTFIGVGLSNVVQNKALLHFDVGASSVSNVNVQNSFFYDNRSYGIAAVSAGNSTMNVTVNQCGFGTEINTGSPINNPGTTITNPPPFSLLVSNSSSALVDYNITNNTFWGADGLKGAIYAVTISGATTVAGSHLIGSFSNNKIGKAGVVGSGASNNSAGLGLLPGVGGTFQANVFNNDIRQVNSSGINFKNSVTGANGTSNVKIIGNTFSEPDVTGSPLFLRAIIVDPGNSGGASMTACAEIGGSAPADKNTISGSWQAGFHIRVTNNNNTVALRLPGLSPVSGATAAQVNTFVESNNTITAGNVGAALGTAGIVGGVLCF